MHLSGLYIYPIKSIAGIALTESFAGERGLQYDRRWMLIDENNRFITQRRYHEMALLKLELEGEEMIVSHASKKIGEAIIPLKIHASPHVGRGRAGGHDLPPDRIQGDRLLSAIWNDEVKVIWPKLKADRWFSEILNVKCRLVYMPDDSTRQIDPDYVPETMNTSLSDGYPYLLAGARSLDDIRKKTGMDIEMKRFRPNLVVTANAAFEEDSWKKIKIGSLDFEIVKPCARCVITTIDPKTGIPGKEPLKTLATYRNQNGKVLFGQNTIIKSEGIIRVGDKISIGE